MKCGIYKFTNKINKKVYIGQSRDISKRYGEHLSCIRNGYENSYFYKAVKKYGFENFTFEILEICNVSSLNEKEAYYVKKYNSFGKGGYNLTNGGDQSVTFQILNNKSLASLIKDLKEEKLSYKELSEKYKINKTMLSLINNGHSHYNSDIKYPIREVTNLSRGVCFLNSDGELLYTFKSIYQAGRELGIDRRNISSAINGRNKSVSGMRVCLEENLHEYLNKKEDIRIYKKGVEQYKLDGTFIQSFDSINQAVLKTGVSKSTIKNVITGRTKKPRNFLWKRRENEQY